MMVMAGGGADEVFRLMMTAGEQGNEVDGCC